MVVLRGAKAELMGTRFSVEEEGSSPRGTPLVSAWRKYRPESLDARTRPLVS